MSFSDGFGLGPGSKVRGKKQKSLFLSENSLERSLTGIFGRPSVIGPLK